MALNTIMHVNIALCPTQNKGYEFYGEFVTKICICLHLYFIDLSSFLILFFKSSSFLKEKIPHDITYVWNLKP